MDIQGIGVVIPAYNAERTLASILDHLLKWFPRENIIVVDDGSTDKTADAASSSGIPVVQHSENRGKGAALKTGFEEASRRGLRFLVCLDADGQHDPASVPAFLNYMENHPGSQVIIGHRQIAGTSMPLHRRLSNYLTSRILSSLAGQTVLDAQCGFRLISVEVFNSLGLVRDDFFCESELIVRAAHRGIMLHWVPIDTIYNGQPSMIRPVKDTIAFIFFVINIWLKNNRT